MNSYLDHIDVLKRKYIEEKMIQNSAIYIPSNFYYYERIIYNVDQSITFRQELIATKLNKTSILFRNQENKIGVYFTDNDIKSIIASIGDSDLKKYIIDSLNKVINQRRLEPLSFHAFCGAQWSSGRC